MFQLKVVVQLYNIILLVEQELAKKETSSLFSF